jgi:uncharacterized phage protein (TIGR02218 family)
LQVADLFTFTLLNGSVYRFTDFDLPVVIGGNTYINNGPLIKRSLVKWTRGVAVDSMDVTIADDNVDSPATLIGGFPILQALTQRAFDGASCQLDRAFSAPGVPNWQGPLTLFLGRVSEIQSIGRASAKLTVNSMIDILNIRMPRNLFGSSCRWTLFDAGCTLNKATFAVSSSALTGSNASIIKATLAQATGHFALGYLIFTSGVNNGLTRSIKTFAAGSPAQIVLSVPLPSAPGIGDTFTIYPGCDKTQSTCTSKFSNLVNYGGEPYVPAPETAIGLLFTLIASDLMYHLFRICGGILG